MYDTGWHGENIYRFRETLNRFNSVLVFGYKARVGMEKISIVIEKH